MRDLHAVMWLNERHIWHTVATILHKLNLIVMRQPRNQAFVFMFYKRVTLAYFYYELLTSAKKTRGQLRTQLFSYAVAEWIRMPHFRLCIALCGLHGVRLQLVHANLSL